MSPWRRKRGADGRRRCSAPGAMVRSRLGFWKSISSLFGLEHRNHEAARSDRVLEAEVVTAPLSVCTSVVGERQQFTSQEVKR